MVSCTGIYTTGAAGQWGSKRLAEQVVGLIYVHGCAATHLQREHEWREQDLVGGRDGRLAPHQPEDQAWSSARGLGEVVVSEAVAAGGGQA